MLEVFQHTSLPYQAGPHHGGDAYQTVITPADFSQAVDEISSWPGYQPTPLHSLSQLAGQIRVAGGLAK